jgi:DNA-binding SARP family transcriptional activator/ABC-type branched-subunit amino acid transport system substrate-binding protein/streptogramin lyase
MDFRLLGPLEVTTMEGAADVGGGKRAALLAYLLINANEVVSTDRLIDELWGERPPATAAKSVQVYVSQLRKALHANGDLLVTRGSGYMLKVEGEELDIERFERRLAEAQRALSDGDAETAATTAREALALWRGPPLYDVAYERFAQHEVARLEKLRLLAIETRIDADLVLGRHAELVGELDALVAEHPSHERFRAQLMVALYRSGRQADALEAYRCGSRVLRDELGLEPNPELRELEQKILTHDPELDAPRVLRPRARGRKRPPARGARRGGWLIGAGGALLALVALLALGESLGSGGGSKHLANSVAMLDPSSGDIVKFLPVGQTPSDVSVGAGSVWALAADDQTITQIDPRSKRADTFSIGATPTAVAAGAGALWVGTGEEQPTEAGVGTSRLLRLDPVLHTVEDRIELPQGGVQDVERAAGQLAVAGGAVWVVTSYDLLVRVDPRLNQARAVPSLRVRAMVPAGRSVWAITPEGTSIVEISTRTARVRRRLELHAARLDAIAAGAGAVWVADSFEGTLWRINPGGKLTTSTIDVGEGADEVAVGRGAVWITNSTHGTVTRVDPATDRVTKVISLGDTPRAVATGAGAVWVAVAGADKTLQAASSAYAGGPRPLADCGKVVTGADGHYDRLIAADFPLQRTFPQPVAAAHAVLYVLRQHHFRAGRFRLGYQLCNSATPDSSQSDMKKCVANAHAYATTPAVIGVVGPWESSCAFAGLPVLNRATVPVVAPYTTMAGLTQVDPTLPQATLKHLYPAGVRNFVRVIGTDSTQAGADVLLARRLGLQRVYLLYDDTDYGLSLATLFRAAARAQGVPLAGVARWNRDGLGFRALARRVRAAGADAVILSGVSASNGPPLVEALRAGGGRRLTLIGTDGFAPTDFIHDASHGAAKGMYSSLVGLWDPQLGASGERFRHEFQPTQNDLHVGAESAYAAAATEALLDAIARSDGTRRSVVRALFRTRLADSPVGAVRFDRNGDVVGPPTAILRILGGKGSGYSTVPYYEGARLDRVIRPPAPAVP